MFAWLSLPYPFETRWRYILLSDLAIGLFITFFLFLFKPFGTKIPEGAEWPYFWACAGFGLVSIVISLFLNLLCSFLPGVFAEEKWTVGKEIIFNLFFIGCIGLGNLFYASILWDIPFSARTFWGWQGYTFAVGFFPIVFGAFFGQMQRSHRYALEASALSQTKPVAHEDSEIPVILTGENQNETLQLKAYQIAYLVARDNYVQVFYFENRVLRSKMLRATMRKLETALEAWPQFFRCHRTFLVNFDKVEKISGNAQGYRLHK